MAIKNTLTSKGLRYALIAAASFISSYNSQNNNQEIVSQPININYSSLDKDLESVDFENDSTKSRFILSIKNLKKYDLEKHIDEYCDEFGMREEEVVPYMINESNLNPYVKANNGCVGVGQMSLAAVKSVNSFYDKDYKHGGNAENQIASSIAYFSKKFNEYEDKYPELDRDTLLDLTYFAYNGGGAPVDLAVKRIKKSEKDVSWLTLEEELDSELLSSSSKYYKNWSSSARNRKVRIIRDYVENAQVYRNYFDQLREIYETK